MSVRKRRELLQSLFTPGSRKFWSLKNDSGRVLYTAFLANADDLGRLEGGADDVKSLVPRSNWEVGAVETDLRDMARVGLITRYKVKGSTFIEITDFIQSQTWHQVSDRGSNLPAPPNKHRNGALRPPKGCFETTIGQNRLSDRLTDRLTECKDVRKKERTSDIHTSTHTTDEPQKKKSNWRATLTESQRAYRRITKKDFGQPGKHSERLEQWISLCEKHAQHPEQVVAGVENFAREKSENESGKKLYSPVSLFLDRADEYIEAAKDEESDEMGEYPDSRDLPKDW